MKKRMRGRQLASVGVSVLLFALAITVLARHSAGQAVAVAQVSGVVVDPSGAAIAAQHNPDDRR